LYNEISENIVLKDFVSLKALSRLFVPVATFDEADKVKDEEFVAVIEGIVYPFFGFAFSIDKV
jgi:hypothetical protein